MDKIRSFFGRKDQVSEVWGSGGIYHGLENQGATCYLNSVLQVLYMTKDFRERVKRNNSEPEYIDSELSDLFLELEGKNAFTHNITNKLRINNVHEQRDAADIYEKILRLTSPGASQIFHGKLTNSNTCQKCHTKTEDEVGCWHLPLPLGNDGDCSVERGILDFFRQSEMSGDDQMYCEFCDEKCDAILVSNSEYVQVHKIIQMIIHPFTQECEMAHPPEVLVLLLKRFEFDHTLGKYLKNNSFVDVPFVLNIQNQTYELHAFVEHLGEQRFGRYIATIRCQYDGIWYLFDDSNVTVSRNQYFQLYPSERSPTAYLLFYQRKADKYNGLLNLGATCYLNSVLQVLFMTEDFRERIKNHVRNNPKTDRIDRELSDLFSELEESSAYTYNIVKKLEINSVYQQRDAAEHYEKILRLTSPEASQIFHGELKNIRTCLNCEKKTKSTTRFWHLALSLVESEAGCSVHRSFQDFCHREVQMYCEFCDKRCDATLYCELNIQPEVLVFLIKRFDYDEKQMRNVKNNTAVEVPFTLHMALTYELFAFVDHYGELGYGHYIARILSKEEGRWYIFDDVSVIPDHFQEHYTEFKSQAAYLLFYRKQKDTSCKEEVSAPETSQDATAEQNTNDNKEKEGKEQTISNAAAPKLSDEPKNNGEKIHEKTQGIWTVQENNQNDHKERFEDRHELHFGNSDRKESCHFDVESLTDSFKKMTIVDCKDSHEISQNCELWSQSQHGPSVNDSDQMYDLQSDDEYGLGACALAEAYNIREFESLMDIGGDLTDGGGERQNKWGEEKDKLIESSQSEMPFEMKGCKLNLTLRQKNMGYQGQYEKTRHRDCPKARVKPTPQPYHIHYPRNEEDFKRVEATRRFIEEEQELYSSSVTSVSNLRSQPNIKRCEQRAPRRDKERASSHKSRFNGVESLGVIKKGDTETLYYQPKRSQDIDKQGAEHEQNESDISDGSRIAESSQDPETRFVTQV